MTVSLLSFTANALLLKHMSSACGTGPWMALLFRAGTGFLITLAFFPSVPRGSPRPRLGGLDIRRAATGRMLVSRGILGAFGTAAYYVTLPVLGAGKATLIGNTWVIWSALMAVFVLKEHLSMRQGWGIVVAILGLVLLTGMDHHTLAAQGLHEWIAITGALIAAATVVVIRQLTRTESSATIFASQCIYTGLLALPFVIKEGFTLSVSDSALLTLAGCMAGAGQLTMTEGFRHLPVSIGGAFQVVLPLSITLGGIVFFGESFSLAQVAGATLIVSGGYLTLGVRKTSRFPPQPDS